MAELARFIDRFTIEYVRTYPHPIERVWRAVTDPAEVETWFMKARFDLRAGGAWLLGVEEHGFAGVITALDPPRRVRFAHGPGMPGGEGGYLQYELSEVADGTRLVFVQHFTPGATYAPTPDDPGGDLPAGPDTPWKPGFVGGWHELFDALGDRLDGVEPGSRLPPTHVSEVAGVWARGMVGEGAFDQATADRYRLGLRREEEAVVLNGLYREHIKAACPPAGQAKGV
ncbi:MAG TPA: SRPBCC domain-containing protein [Caulobacteraceae bacterium]|jgi:uncharacterized protein YndB with AHSA1/START domain|nr:SRPBCC domain-containing protein [Caulobacteraceae bacterium]